MPVWQEASGAGWVSDIRRLRRGGRSEAAGPRSPGSPRAPSLTAAHTHSSCAERDEWHGCLSRALPEDYKAQALAAFHHSVEVSGGPGPPDPRCTALGCPGQAHAEEDLQLLPSGHWFLLVLLPQGLTSSGAGTAQPQPGAQRLQVALLLTQDALPGGCREERAAGGS